MMRAQAPGTKCVEAPSKSWLQRVRLPLAAALALAVAQGCVDSPTEDRATPTEGALKLVNLHPARQHLTALAHGFGDGDEHFEAHMGSTNVRVSRALRAGLQLVSGPGSLTVRPLSAQDVTGEVLGGEVVFANAYGPGVHAVERPVIGGVDELVFIPDDTVEKALSYEVHVSPDVVGSVLSDGGLRFVADSGVTLWALAAPFVLDARGVKRPARLRAVGCDAAGVAKSCVVTVSWTDLAKLEYPLLLDPQWTSIDPTITAHSHHTATLLSDGRVLLAGGFDSTGVPQSQAEIYDPTSRTWRATAAMNQARAWHADALLPNGKVLVSGGFGPGFGLLATAEVFDPLTETWTATGAMGLQRFAHRLAEVGNNSVLAAAGKPDSYGLAGATSTAEIYDTLLGTWSPTGPLTNARWNFQLTSIGAGQLIASGGENHSALQPAVERFDPVNVPVRAWT